MGNYQGNLKTEFKHLAVIIENNPQDHQKILSSIINQKIFLQAEFWEAYEEVDKKLLGKTFLSKIEEAQIFYTHFNLLSISRDSFKQLLFQDSDKPLSAKQLFMLFGMSTSIGASNNFPELPKILAKAKNNFFQTSLFHNYSFHSLIYLNRIIKRATEEGLLVNKNIETTDLQYAQLYFLDRMIFLEKELDILEGMIDAWLNADFNMDYTLEDDRLKQVLLRPNTDSELNRLRSSLAKTQYRKLHYQQHAADVVSDDPHFQEIDKEFRTNEGIIGVITSPGPRMTSNSPGIISIESEELFKGTEEEIQDKFLYQDFLQKLHYKYRKFREKSTFPSDTENIKKTVITLANQKQISLQAIFKVIDFLSALSDAMRSTDGPSILKAKKLKILQLWAEKDKNLRISPELLVESDKALFELSKTKLKDFFYSFPIRLFLNLLKETTQLTLPELFSCLRILAISHKNEFEFQLLLIHKGQIYWKWESFVDRSLSQFLYDQYFLERIYVKEGHHESRAKAYDERLANYFKHAGFKSTSNIKYGDQKGELDVVAEKDTYIFLIEIKLSNRQRETFKDQKDWNFSKIDRKARKQMNRALEFFSEETNQELLKDKLGLALEKKKFTLIPLIVTDNFYYVDQREIDDSVRVVSFFELYLILNNLSLLKPNSLPEYSVQPIQLSSASLPTSMLEGLEEFEDSVDASDRKHKNQQIEVQATDPRKFEKWWDHEDGISANYLLGLIEQNKVWSFLDEELRGFENKNGLSLFRGEFRYDI